MGWDKNNGRCKEVAVSGGARLYILSSWKTEMTEKRRVKVQKCAIKKEVTFEEMRKMNNEKC